MLFEAPGRVTRVWHVVSLLLVGVGGLSLLRPLRTAGEGQVIEYSGCSEVWLEDTPRCVFDPDKALLLWIDHPDRTTVEIRVDGKPREHTDTPFDLIDGFRATVMLPPTASILEVAFSNSSAPVWSLPLISNDHAANIERGVRSSRDIDRIYPEVFGYAVAGQHRAALQHISEIEYESLRFPKGRADYATYLGMIQWWQGSFYDAAISLREGVVFATKFDDPGLQKDAVPLYSAVLAELGFLDAAAVWARRALEIDTASPKLFSCVEKAKLRSTLGWVGLLQTLQGDEPPYQARELLEGGIELVNPGRECPDPSVVPGLSLTLALFELHEGGPDAASAALARLEAVDLDAATPDQRVRLADAKVQASLALGRGHDVDRASSQLADAVGRFNTPEGHWRLALRTGDFLAAREDLEGAIEEYRVAEDLAHELMELAAVGVGRETAGLLHAQSTEGLVSLLGKVGRADEAFCAAREAQARRIHAVSTASDNPTDRAEIARASAAYVEERHRLDQELAKEGQISQRERDRLRTAVRSREGDLAKIVDRIVRKRSTWWPTCEQLTPRETGENRETEDTRDVRDTGELLLGLYPAHGGWFTFVEDDRGTEMRWLAGGPRHAAGDPRLGEDLLEPWDERLASARSVRVLAGGRAQHIDVHLLEWRGARLIQHKPVVYGAELPALHASAHALGPTPHVLLVADPTETLRGAWDEATAVHSVLEPLCSCINMPPPNEADLQRVRKGLDGADLFYYAGHAGPDDDPRHGMLLPPYAGGTRNWPARLRLASSSALEVHDILTLPSVPPRVALMGCQTGVSADLGGGMSLALAFLVAGSHEVVATPEDTKDEDGPAIGKELAQGLAQGDGSLADALQRAQTKLLERGEPVGRYRVWVR